MENKNIEACHLNTDSRYWHPQKGWVDRAEESGEIIGEVLRKHLSALDVQVGSDHYKKWKIQPIEFIQANNLSYEQGNILKYIMRHADKNGKEDLEKAKHYIDLMIEHHYKDGEAK